VMGGLKKLAEPFEDTPNTVIRRLLEDKGVLPKVEHDESEKLTSESVERTPQEALRLPLLQVLNEMGGSGRPKEVLEKLGKKIKDKLTLHDYSKTPSGATRWKVYARWVRHRMRKEGLLGGPAGRWMITEK